MANIIAGTLSIAASVTAAVMSMGTLAFTILSTAKTLLQMTYNYFRDLAKLEKEIIDADLVIQETWKKASNSGKIVGRDLADALGVPFVKSVSGLRKLLEEYNAKSGKGQNEAERMWKQAKEMMVDIDKMPEGVGDKEQKAKLGKTASELLDQISETMSASKSQDLFYSTYLKRLQKYDKMEADLGSARLAPATELLAKLGGLLRPRKRSSRSRGNWLSAGCRARPSFPLPAHEQTGRFRPDPATNRKSGSAAGRPETARQKATEAVWNRGPNSGKGNIMLPTALAWAQCGQ